MGCGGSKQAPGSDSSLRSDKHTMMALGRLKQVKDRRSSSASSCDKKDKKSRSSSASSCDKKGKKSRSSSASSCDKKDKKSRSASVSSNKKQPSPPVPDKKSSEEGRKPSDEGKIGCTKKVEAFGLDIVACSKKDDKRKDSTDGATPSQEQSTNGATPSQEQSTDGAQPSQKQSTDGNQPSQEQSTEGTQPSQKDSTSGAPASQEQTTEGTSPAEADSEAQTTEEGDAPGTAKKQRLLNFRYVQAKLRGAGIRALLEELSTAREADPRDVALEQLMLTLQLAQDALKEDPGQLPAQLLARITQPCPGLEPLLEQCCGADDLLLLPNRPVVLPPGGPLVHTVQEHTSIVTCMVMTSDGKYVITCGEKGSVVVIEVQRGVRERKLAEVEGEPVTVHLCCDDTLVVTSTRAQVTAHHFQSGAEAWKLEGEELMFYPACLCVAGNTVVIFQNVTVITYDAATGGKVDSLDILVDADELFLGYQKIRGTEGKAIGKDKYAVAVASDCEHIMRVNLTDKSVLAREIQDPETQEENLFINAITIVGDPQAGMQVVISHLDRRDLIFLDIDTLDPIRVLKGDTGDRNIYTFPLHPSRDQRYLYFPAGPAGVFVWDLKDGSVCAILPEARGVKDVFTADMKRYVTITDDRNVRIWDASKGGELNLQARTVVRVEKKGDNTVEREGSTEDLGPKTPDVCVSDCVMSDNACYVLLQVQEVNVFSLRVFDVATGAVVRQLCLGQKGSKFSHVQGSHWLVDHKQRLRLVDMDKMAVIREFSGMTSKHPMNSPTVIQDGKGVMTATKGGHDLKFFDMESGKVTKVIRQERFEHSTSYDEEATLDGPAVSKDGTVAVVGMDEAYMCVDLVKLERQHVVKLFEMDYDNYSVEECAALTDDGRYLVFVGKTGDDGTDVESKECVVVYDLHEGTEVRKIIDMTPALTYEVEEERDDNTDVSEIKLLHNRYLVAGHDDHVIRVYDIHTGEVLHRLPGHQGSPSIHVRQDSAVFLSHEQNRTYGNVRVWSATDFSPLASFTCDTKVDSFLLLPGHNADILGLIPDDASPVVLSVRGQKKDQMLGQCPPLTSYPEVYPGTKLDGELPEPPELYDDDDPDKDAASDSDSDDDDDDDSDDEDE